MGICVCSQSVWQVHGSDESNLFVQFFQSLAVVCKYFLIASSDSCGRQNKNFYMVCFWVYTIVKGSQIFNSWPYIPTL